MTKQTGTRAKRVGGLSDRASDIFLVVICLFIAFLVAYPLY